MKLVISVTSTAIAAAIIGMGILLAVGVHPQIPAVLTALAAIFLACTVAAVPLHVVRGATTLPVTQAGLVSTMLHMVVPIIIAAAVLFGKLPVGSSFVFWLAAFYFITLAALVVQISRAIHAAPTTAPKI